MSRNVVATIHRVRKARGWSEEKLADEITAAGHPVSRAIMSNLRRPHTRVDIDLAVVAAKVLGLTLDELVSDKPSCDHCSDAPPRGFNCARCGRGGTW